MAYGGQSSDYYLNIARGLVSGVASVIKWGRATNGVQTTLTDIWDRADATPTQQIWIAPTAARVHALVSTSASDTSAGVGARQVTVYGLTTWDTAESSEVVTMNGTTPVNTASSYVIIHRMIVTSFGSSGPNVGIITATAATDATVTAQINAANGQTEMAIYGIPSTQTAYLLRFDVSMNDSVATARVDFKGRVVSNPVTQPNITVTKRSFNLVNTGTSYQDVNFDPPMRLPGPAILKLSGIGSAADIDASGGFDLILINN